MRIYQLCNLATGTPFKIDYGGGFPPDFGTVVKVSESGVVVEFDRGRRRETFVTAGGEVVQFIKRIRPRVQIARGTEVTIERNPDNARPDNDPNRRGANGVDG